MIFYNFKVLHMPHSYVPFTFTAWMSPPCHGVVSRWERTVCVSDANGPSICTSIPGAVLE